MPRAKVKTKDALGNVRDFSETIPENLNGGTQNKAADLSMFKFEKKPHVKIEFEKESPKKNQEESRGLWEPANWKEFLINLRNMRSNNDAPVDTMGCHMAMDENAPPKVMRYQSLIALMLSSQTKDQVTFAAMERLREAGLTVDNVLKLSDEELGKLIYPVGFWKTKVKYIKKTTQTLKEQYDGDIPDSVDKLCKLTGVGPKMAHICMQVAWKKTTGIGVDTHVHRISNRIGWVRKPTATPEDTRKALESWLPFNMWSEVNHLMVGFGQTICQPVNPICHECLNSDICPSSGKIGRKSPNKKQNVKDIIKEEFLSPIKDKNVLLVSPIKERVNPKKKAIIKEEFLSPIKDENVLHVSPIKQRVTPKKKAPISQLTVPKPVQLTVDLNSDPAAPTRKRKVTPKKNLEVINEYMDLTKLGSDLSALIPNKKRVTPKKVNVVGDEILVGQIDSETVKKSPKKHTQKNNVTNTITKKSPNKRKALAKTEIVGPSNDEIGEVIPTRKTRSNESSKASSTKALKASNVDLKTTQLKRKSPRNIN